MTRVMSGGNTTPVPESVFVFIHSVARSVRPHPLARGTTSD